MHAMHDLIGAANVVAARTTSLYGCDQTLLAYPHISYVTYVCMHATMQGIHSIYIAICMAII